MLLKCFAFLVWKLLILKQHPSINEHSHLVVFHNIGKFFIAFVWYTHTRTLVIHFAAETNRWISKVKTSESLAINKPTRTRQTQGEANTLFFLRNFKTYSLLRTQHQFKIKKRRRKDYYMKIIKTILQWRHLFWIYIGCTATVDTNLKYFNILTKHPYKTSLQNIQSENRKRKVKNPFKRESFP